MKMLKRLLKIIGLGLSFGVCALGVASCSTTKKEATSYDFTVISCSYRSETGTTLIRWSSELVNNSIYDIKRETFSFDLYNGTTYLKNESYTYIIEIKHGQTNTGIRWFETSGNVSNVELKSWDAEFTTVWETYKAWFIATIVVASVLSVAYIIVLIVIDFELEDAWEFLTDNLWLLPILLAGLIPYVIVSIINSVWSWVPPFIILGGILVLILMILLSHLVKFLVYDRFMYIDYSECALEEEPEEKPSEKPKSKKQTMKKTNIKFNDIAGLDDAKKAFEEKVIMPFEHPELFKKFGKKVGGGILLYGLPGTGKTMFAEAAANEMNALFIPIKCSDIKSKWYGESEKNVSEIFDRARKAKKAIIFFDEFEAIGSKRTDNSDNANNDLVPQILAEMQGVGASSEDVTLIVIAATNKPWAIDSAFLRPGRFDEKIYVPLPDFDARKKLFELQLKKLPISDDLDFDYLANITDGFNGADIKEVCEKLKMSAINDSLEKGKDQTIGMDDVHRIENTLKSSVSIEDIEKIKEFESR